MPEPARLTWAGVVARRLERQALVQPATDLDPAGVASLLCGVHAQMLGAAELAIGRRIAGATRSDVQRSLWEERTLVKTFGPRGTVHVLATADLPLWTGAFSALPASVPHHPEPVRFSATEADEVIAAIGDALQETELTVDELTAAIRERTGEWAVERTMDAFQDKWPRWRQLTSTAAQRGVLCFGPNKGRNVTYTNPHRWLTGFEPVAGSEAVSRLVRCYLHVFGPASPAAFAQWLGIPPRAARHAFDALGDELEMVDMDGEGVWVTAGDLAVPQEPATGVRLLSYFDAYVVAGQPRARLFPDAAATRALTPTGQAGNYPVLLIDGVVGGVWHQRQSGKRVVITVEPLRELTKAHLRGLEAEAVVVGRVLEAEPVVTIGPVTVGAHA
jgi:hypothetical protein